MRAIIVEWVSLAVAAASAVVSAWHYRRNSRQTSAIKAADEMERFHTDKSVLIAERLMDYSACYITLEKPSGQVEEIAVGPMDFHMALRHHSLKRNSVTGYDIGKDIFATKMGERELDPSYLFSEREHYIRDAFDGFLGRLERVDALISKEVISPDDFHDHFSYWIKLIGDPKGPDDHFSDEKRRTLIGYINKYEFNGVIRLFARYGKDLSRRNPVPLTAGPQHSP